MTHSFSNIDWRWQRRRWTSKLMSVLFSISILVVLLPLIFIVGFLVIQGASSLNWNFLTRRPAPVGEIGGGMGNAIVGSFLVILLAMIVGVPLGILGGIFLGEFPNSRLSQITRFAADVLNGTPSIVVGVFAYSVIVMPMHHFSALAGGLALGIMMIPIMLRTTDEMLQLVPTAIREASLALGVPYWKTVVKVVLSTARSGLITGMLLAVARIAGETAPLLFTAFNNAFWTASLTQPISTLTVQIYAYAISPYDDWHRQAWAGALLLLILVFGINIMVRTVTRKRHEANY
ncbi:MAG: phosphate ABC transporter permease PstA [Bacteroidota bacterium]